MTAANFKIQTVANEVELVVTGGPAWAPNASPIRKASVALEDPHGTNLWAGTAYREARSGPAKDIVKTLGDV